MTTAILSCPFCNHDDVEFDESGSDIFVTCPNCQTLGPRAPGINDAILLWNRCGDKPVSPLSEALASFPLGLTADDVDFVLTRYDVAFEPSEHGGYFKTGQDSERERTLLTILRKMIEKGIQS